MADHPSEVTCHSISHISADTEDSSFFSVESSSSFICMNISHVVHWGFSPCRGKTSSSNLPAGTFFLVERRSSRALKVLLLQIKLGQITHKCWILLGVSAWEKEAYSDGSLHWGFRQRPISLGCAGRIWRVTALRPPTCATKVLIPPRSQLLSLSCHPSFTWPLGQMPLSCPGLHSCQVVDRVLHPNGILFQLCLKAGHVFWWSWQMTQSNLSCRKSMWLHCDVFCLLVTRTVNLIWRNSGLVFKLFSHV